MKLPLSNTFGYIYNWQSWVNNDDNCFYTFCGLGVILGQIMGSTLLLLCKVNDKYLHFTTNNDFILVFMGILYVVSLIYIYFAFIFHKRYKSFVNNQKYKGRNGRIKTIAIFLATIIYLFIGFLSPCYL